jgi:glycosyltransferase involved in cell wall biosynthesis
MKVLVSAYACEPDRGSEPGVGWNWVEQVARFNEVWVLTRHSNRPAIERGLRRRPAPNVHWVYLDLPRWSRFWKRGQRGVHLYYYLWQVAAYARARRLDRDVCFDVVHHVTFVNYWIPSFLAFLPRPFVWGPVGGGESAPRGFRCTLSRRGRRYERARDLVRALGERDWFVRQTARRARAVLATTGETAARLARLSARNVRILSQAALSEDEIARLGHLPVRMNGLYRIVSVGRLVEWKGFHLALAAFAMLRESVPASEYWIIGEGPDRRRLERTVRELGLEDAVRLKGSMSRGAIFDHLAECDVLVHPSLHDSGAWVCAEAMAARRPVVCLALGGPLLQVTDDTGFAIRAETPDLAVRDMSAALMRLARDAELRRRMGEAARDRVIQMSRWDQRGDFIDALYNEVNTQPVGVYGGAG